MALLQTLRSFVNERLSVAVEEIFVVVERILTEYEDQAFSSKQQIEQQQRILDVVLKPDIRLHKTEFQHRPVCEEVSPEHQERNPSLAQEEPEPPQIKEEQELLQSPEEAVGSTQTLLAVKHEDDGENRETEPLANTSTEHILTQSDVEDCGTSQPTSDDQLLSSHCSESESDTEDSDEWEETSQTSQSDTEDSDEWEETSQAQSAIKTQKSHKTQNVEGQILSLRNKKDSKSSKQTPPMRSHIGGNIFICTLCGKVFGHTCLLKKHMRMHTAEKPFNCTVCSKSFCHRVDLKRHARSHAGEKPFACLFCNKGFSHSVDLEKHKKLLTCTI